MEKLVVEKSEELKRNFNVGAEVATCPEKGITLVALVITIIVLIILAGVSINAVMNEGLITNAKDAKNQYEEGKVNESIDISNYTSKTEIYVAEKELEKEGIKYNTSKKYITGVKVDENGVETVKAFMERVPGYVVYKDGTKVTDTEAETLTMATGMVVKKVDASGNETEIGTVIVYGDVNKDGVVDYYDQVEIEYYIDGLANEITTEIQRIAADVNHDGYITTEDSDIIANYDVGSINDIEQNVEAEDVPLWYITGIKFDGVTETVKAFMERNAGYAVYRDGTKVTDEEVETLTMATGMLVKEVDENGKETELGIVIVYGDVDKSGTVDLDDKAEIDNLVCKRETLIAEDIQKIAADVNHDGKINLDDSALIEGYMLWTVETIEQDVNAVVPTIEYNEE